MKRTGKQGNGKGRARRTKIEPVRFAVVGQGYFAQAAVLPAFAAARECELRALFSGDDGKLKALGRKYRVAATLGYDQYDEYLRSGQVDAVYIAEPNDKHHDFAIRAAEAGVHVLCEKPLAVTAGEAQEIVDACRQKRVKLMVAYRLHFEEATLEAIDRVKRGALGRPRFFSSTFAMQVEDDNIRTKRKRGGGPLLDLGIYCVNAARKLFAAEPIEVVAMSASRDDDPRFAEVDEQVSATLRFPDDRLAQFTCSFGACDHSALTVIGEKGRLSLDPAYEYATGLTVETEIKGKRRSDRFGKHDQIAAELVAFARYVREDRDPEPSGQEGLADMRVLDAIQRAVESGQTEKVAAVARRDPPDRSQAIRRPAHGMPSLVGVEPPGRDG